MTTLSPVLRIINRGGSGSGNFGHEGRPGEVGGSTPGLNFNTEVTDFYSGQTNGFIRANDAGHNYLGHLDYQQYGDNVQIAWVTVKEQARRQGIGIALVKQLQHEFPDKTLQWGWMTPEGAALRKTMLDRGLITEPPPEKPYEPPNLTQETGPLPERGGEGSGNFGHAGRPGEVGGSAAGEGTTLKEGKTGMTPNSPQVRQMASSAYAGAVAREPELSNLLESVAATTGGTLAGFDFRLKREDSVARKIITDAIEKDITPEQAAADMTDLNRYTVIYEEPDIVAHILEAERNLSEAGYEKYDNKWRNFFAAPGGSDQYNSVYHGYNTVWINPETGDRFEVQFHTPDTYRAKDAAHVAYERYRVLPSNSPERSTLWDQMTGLWRNYTPPAMFERLPGICMGCAA